MPCEIFAKGKHSTSHLVVVSTKESWLQAKSCCKSCCFLAWWAMANRSAPWPISSNFSASCLDPLDEVDWSNAAILTSFIVLGIINVVVIGGNTLVIMAVFLYTKLRTVTNLFIVSLAVADLFVGVAVLPFSTTYEVLHIWVFGQVWCKMWLAVDVWLCTSSILNLCAISLDRYLAVTRPVSYPSLMSSRRAKILIAGVWIISFVICLPPLIGWSDAGALLASEPLPRATVAPLSHHPAAFDTDSQFEEFVLTPANNLTVDADFWDVEADLPVRVQGRNFSSKNNSIPAGGMIVGIKSIGCQCQLISDRGYRIYSALGSFYLPMLVMMFFYWRIYRAAVETTRAINQGFRTTTMGGRFDEQRLTLRIHRGRSSADLYGTKSNGTCSSQNSFRQKEHGPSGAGGDGGLLSPLPALSPKSSVLGYKGSSKASLCASVSLPPTTKRKMRALKNAKRKVDVSDSSAHVRRSARHQWLMVNHERSNSGRESIMETEVSCRATSESSEHGLEGGNGEGRSDHSTSVCPRMGRRNIKAQVKRFRMETKAAKTLGIIVGGFILCWLPFFTIYLVGAFCDEDCIPASLFSVFFWLGYCNSAINPCVYALFSRDFRYAFKKILCRCTFSEEMSIKERIVTMFPPTIHLSSFGEEGEGGSDSH